MTEPIQPLPGPGRTAPAILLPGRRPPGHRIARNSAAIRRVGMVMSIDREQAGSTGGSRKLDREERERFLAEPHVGILSVGSDDDRPPSTLPTWYAYRPGGTISIITRQGKRKSRLIRNAGTLSFSVQRPQVPYRYVTVEGTVVAQRPATRAELVAIGQRYLPEDALDPWADWETGGGNANGTPEYVEIRPDRWLTADFAH